MDVILIKKAHTDKMRRLRVYHKFVVNLRNQKNRITDNYKAHIMQANGRNVLDLTDYSWNDTINVIRWWNTEEGQAFWENVMKSKS